MNRGGRSRKKNGLKISSDRGEKGEGYANGRE